MSPSYCLILSSATVVERAVQFVERNKGFLEQRQPMSGSVSLLTTKTLSEQNPKYYMRLLALNFLLLIGRDSSQSFNPLFQSFLSNDDDNLDIDGIQVRVKGPAI